MIANTKTDNMKYEVTGKQEVSDYHEVERRAYRKLVNSQSTFYTLWLLIIKHKVGLLLIGNIILVLNWIFPPWVSLVQSLIG